MRMITRRLPVVSALLLFVMLGVGAGGWSTAGALPSDASPTGSISIALLDIPADRADDPRAQSYIVDNIPPGQSIKRRVSVTNHTGAPAKLDVYTGPAVLENGAFTPKPRGESSPLTEWVTLSTDEVDLENGESAEVLVTISVPEDAPEIEQYGLIWLSTKDPEVAPGEQVRQVARVGVRMYVSVGEGNGPPSDFGIDSLVPQRDEDGNAVVAAQVTNIGGRAVDISGVLDLGKGPGGLTATAVSAQTLTIGPGDSGQVVFAIPDSASFPAGPWSATARLSSGWIEHSMRAELTFPDAGAGEPVEGDRGLSAVAWAAIIAGLLVAVAVAYVLVRRRQSAAIPGDTEISGS